MEQIQDLEEIARWIAIILAFLVALAFYLSVQLGRLLGEGLAWLFDHIPIVGEYIGDRIRDAVEWLTNGIYSAVTSLYAYATRPLEDLFDSSANRFRSMVYASSSTHQETVGQLNYISGLVTTAVPEPTQSHVLDHVVGSAITLVGQLAQTYNISIGYSQQVYETAVTWANTAINVVYQDVLQAEQQAQAAVASVQQEIADEHDSIVGFVQHSRDYAIQTAETWTNDAIQQVDSTIGYVSDQLNGRVTQEQQDRAAAVGLAFDEMGRINNDILNLIMTQVIPRVATIENFDEECSKPMCDNMLDFSQLFGIARGLLNDVTLVAFFIELLRGGGGVAEEIAGEAENMLEMPLGYLNSLLGR